MTTGSIKFELEVGTVPPNLEEMKRMVESFFATDVRVNLSSVDWDMIEATPHARGPRSYVQGTATIHGWATR